jgi:hypothetical protein
VTTAHAHINARTPVAGLGEKVMDVKTARRVRNHLYRTVNELNESIRIVKTASSDDEMQKYRRSCGTVIAGIWELLAPILREHPQLKPEELKDIQFESEC